MKTHKFYLFILMLLILASCSRPEKRTLVILSMDGFRWDYPNMTSTPNLDRIAMQGVKAISLKPSFPTKTFPNHYTLATGLYPDHHGIVQNSFYDPETGRYYAIRDREAVMDASFYEGEPLWVTAEKQGLDAACLFWVGSEAPIDGTYASRWKPYDHDLPFGQRIDTVIQWLSLPTAERPDLVMFYFHEPDATGHDAGPESPENMTIVTRLDSLLGVFIDRMSDLPYSHRVDLVVLSDHGMAANDSSRVVYLYDNIDTTWFSEIQGYNPNYMFMTEPGYEELAEEALMAIPYVQVWKSGEVPARFHYGSNPRTLDYVMVADSGWAIYGDRDANIGKGAHGYDNRNTDMHAIFYAMGPSFKKGYTISTFDNVDIYSLACHILGLIPAENDGDLEDVREMLIDP